MKRLFSITACMLLLGAALPGQRTIPVSIRTLALGPGITKSENYVKTSEGYELLVFLSRHPGQLIDTQPDEAGLPIFKKAIEAGQEIFAVANRIKLPGGASSVLLLGWGNPGNERYLPVDDKFMNAGYNDWLMINTTPKPIGFRIGKDEKPFFIKPNEINTFKVASQEDKGAAVLGRAEMNGEIRTFYSTYWPIRSGERSIVIFVEDNDRIRVKKISDALLKEKERESN